MAVDSDRALNPLNDAVAIDKKGGALDANAFLAVICLLLQTVKFLAERAIFVCKQSEIELMLFDKFLMGGFTVRADADHRYVIFSKAVHVVAKGTSLHSASRSVIFRVKIKDSGGPDKILGDKGIAFLILCLKLRQGVSHIDAVFHELPRFHNFNDFSPILEYYFFSKLLGGVMTSVDVTSTFLDLPRRLRRNRKSPAIRSMLQETHLHPHHLVAPLFIVDGENQRQSISSMPGVFRLSLDQMLKEASELCSLGIRAVDLFAYVPQEKKDRWGSEALHPDNLLARAIRTLKQEIPELCVMVDIALDPYTDHGHDGIVSDKGEILNDASVEALGKMSLLAAEAGADVVAPSDMMDGRIAYIRELLDETGFTSVSILSYAVKFVSAFYGPFRDALQSAPRFGDKKTYQVNPANSREALLECLLDEEEGADMLLIKPALPYLDIIAKARQQTHLPVGAYHVSGEYAMIMAASQNGWINGPQAMLESLISIKRAGADFILTYAARMAAEHYRKFS